MVVYPDGRKLRYRCPPCGAARQVAYRERVRLGYVTPDTRQSRKNAGPSAASVRLEEVLPIEEVYRDDLFCDESAEEIRHAARVLRIQDQIEDETCEFRRQELRDEMRRIVREWDDQHREVG